MSAAVVHAKVNVETKRRLEDEARRTGQTQAEIVGQALDAHLALAARRRSPGWPFDAHFELTDEGAAAIERMRGQKPTASLRRLFSREKRRTQVR